MHFERPENERTTTSSTKPSRNQSWLTRSTILIALLALCGVILSVVYAVQNTKPASALAVDSPALVPAVDIIEDKSGLMSSDEFPTRWPDLLGVSGEEAKAIIIKENPTLSTVVIIPEGSMVTMDYRTDRVRIFVKEDGTVATIPMIG
ncbi:hypothetical protein ACA910_003875 [Epithemia clementina (nom. ined.)]